MKSQTLTCNQICGVTQGCKQDVRCMPGPRQNQDARITRRTSKTKTRVPRVETTATRERTQRRDVNETFFAQWTNNHITAP